MIRRNIHSQEFEKSFLDLLRLQLEQRLHQKFSSVDEVVQFYINTPKCVSMHFWSLMDERLNKRNFSRRFMRDRIVVKRKKQWT
jgi:hypothetical protein